MYKYICEKCNCEFETKKKNQLYCSKSCANSVNASKRKILDKSIFSNGINEETAYILGLIFSDGCLSYDIHSKRYRITISMNDYDILEYLRSTYTPLKKLYVYKNKKGKSETYTFITTDEYDIKFLRIVGVGERKSKYIRLPKINDRYMRDMIRGIFDGDGSVYINKTKGIYKSEIKVYEYVNASFTTGSKKFAEDLLNILSENYINAHIVKDSRKKKECWYVKIYSKLDIEKFYRYLYLDTYIYLDRKRSLFGMMI